MYLCGVEFVNSDRCKCVLRGGCKRRDQWLLQLQCVAITTCCWQKQYLMQVKKKGKKCLTIDMQMK